MNEFTRNFNNLMVELERCYKKAMSYNDDSKIKEMQLLRNKARAYQEILAPLKYDKFKNNNDVNDFYKKLHVFIEKCYKQIDNILTASGV